jgi:hypothetical protein
MDESAHVLLLTAGGRGMAARACSSGEEAPSRSLNQERATRKRTKRKGMRAPRGTQKGPMQMVVMVRRGGDEAPVFGGRRGGEVC